jgi:hypothetical protein
MVRSDAHSKQINGVFFDNDDNTEYSPHSTSILIRSGAPYSSISLSKGIDLQIIGV